MRSEQGFVALVVLILMMSFSLFGLEIFVKSNSQYRIALREAERLNAVELAYGGIEWTKGELALNELWPGGVKVIGEGTIEVEVIKSSDGKGYWVISSAKAGLARRTVKVLLIDSEGMWETSNFEVLYR